ncbi:hypothetical protein DID88_006339 [Monilinia fructigena]|uniref:RNase H type-1 domain-containing protein n=1 Tax=Monilinia fructigena TaxID=38457 RepID=A0A395J3J4_9HELO|nr:hypothetical protein DID88_006339 [Monilinia fructigena]
MRSIYGGPLAPGITGNEAADSLADAGAKSDTVDPGPTVATYDQWYRIDSTKPGSQRLQVAWWRKNEPTLSGGYRKWQLDYALKEPMELKLSRPTLHRLLALRSRHGDFELTINVSSMKTQRLTVHAVKAKTRSTLSSVRSRLGGSTRGR